MRNSISKSVNLKSGDVLEYPKQSGNDASDDRNLRDMTRHGFQSTSESITVEYKIGSFDSDWLTLTTDPEKSPNGWIDGAIWNQLMVCSLKVTAGADCKVTIKSYQDRT